MTADVILVAHHDEQVRATARKQLADEGLLVDEVGDWKAALSEAARVSPCALVVAARLAGVNVLAELTKPRLLGVLGVIVLVDGDDPEDGGRALDAGADDFVNERSLAQDLQARTRAVLRRVAPRALRQFQFGDLVIDLAAREVRVGDEVPELTPLEFDLLAFLASEPSVAFTRAELLEKVWGVSHEWHNDATVTEHIRRIRLKIHDDDPGRHWVRTVRGTGYAFRPGPGRSGD